MAVDPSKVLDYVDFVSYAPRNAANLGTSAKGLAVSTSTARDAMELLSKLDPTLVHVAKTAPDGFAKLVADNDPKAVNETAVNASVLWTEDGLSATAVQATGATTRAGTLSLSFMDSSEGGMDGMAGCAADYSNSLVILHPEQTPQGGWTDTAQWTPCTTSTLSDGSVLKTSSKDYGPFSAVFAVRLFPGHRGAVAATWQNFVSPAPSPGLQQPGPNPERALPQDPVSEAMLRAALSDTKLVPPLPPAPRP